MKKRNRISITIISIIATAIGIVSLLFVINQNADVPATSVVEDNPYVAPGFEEDEEFDENMKFINKNKSNGTVGKLSSFKINNSDAEVSDSTAEDYSTQTESYMLGDVNRDGRVNIKDVTEIQRMIANFVESTDEMIALADVNVDNTVNIFDATQLQKYCVKLIDNLGGSESTIEPTVEPTGSSEDATSNTDSSTPSEDTNNLPPTAPVQNGEWGASVNNG